MMLHFRQLTSLISAAHKASRTNARTKSFFSTFEILDIAQSDLLAAKIMIDAGREDAFNRKTQAATDKQCARPLPSVARDTSADHK